MRTRLVMWGENAQNEKMLVALNLRAEDNKVDIYTFPERITTDDFVSQMHQDWRVGKQVNFPEGYTLKESELTVADSLLPADIKVERADLVQRAQSEWHFVVLSTKLHQSYSSELVMMKDKVSQLSSYSEDVWNDLKGFWDKVQDQLRERNLFREHADELRDETNTLFGKLKELRKAVDDEFQRLSKEKYAQFSEKLDQVEQRLQEGNRINGLFDELKSIQSKFKDVTDITREHRNKVWDRIDAAFKAVKEARFGTGAASSEGSASDRIGRRMEGLEAAIGKMQDSINRDRDDLHYQNNRAANTHGQLEAQLRQAKIAMLEERIRSKEEKLQEMLQTKTDLVSRLASAQAKDAKREDREKERQQVEAAKKAAQDKIASTIQQAAQARTKDEGKIEKAAEALGIATAPAVMPEPITVIDNVVTAEVPGATAPSADADEVITDAADTAAAAVEAAADDVAKEAPSVSEIFGDVVDSAKSVAATIGDLIGAAVDTVGDAVRGTDAKDEETADKKDA